MWQTPVLAGQGDKDLKMKVACEGRVSLQKGPKVILDSTIRGLMSQIRKALSSAILGDQLSAPLHAYGILQPSKQTQTDAALSTKGQGSSPVGCYVRMGSDNLDGNVALEVSYLHLHPWHLGRRTPTFILRPCIRAGAGFAMVQPPGADSSTGVPRSHRAPGQSANQ